MNGGASDALEMAADTAELRKREWGLVSPRLIGLSVGASAAPGAKILTSANLSRIPKPELECMT